MSPADLHGARYYVVLTDLTMGMSLSRAFCTTLSMRFAHTSDKPTVHAELFLAFGAGGAFAENGAFVGLAFSAIDRPVDVRRASRLLLDVRRPRLHAARLFVANSKPWACIA